MNDILSHGAACLTPATAAATCDGNTHQGDQNNCYQKILHSFHCGAKLAG